MSDITSLWHEKVKNIKYNMIFAAVLRTIWITRNDLVFNRSHWLGLQGMWRHTVCSCAQWDILLKEEGRGELKLLLSKLETLARLPPLLSWPEPG
jgi:heme/copper-type cytochrome/quinol oxidase subunit 1